MTKFSTKIEINSETFKKNSQNMEGLVKESLLTPICTSISIYLILRVVWSYLPRFKQLLEKDEEDDYNDSNENGSDDDDDNDEYSLRMKLKVSTRTAMIF